MDSSQVLKSTISPGKLSEQKITVLGFCFGTFEFVSINDRFFGIGFSEQYGAFWAIGYVTVKNHNLKP